MGNCTQPTKEVHRQIELYDDKHQVLAGPDHTSENQLSIRARISKKDSAGIYDYEADQFEEKMFSISSYSGTLAVNRQNELLLTSQKKCFSSSSDYKGLLSFQRLVSGSYCLKPEHAITSDLGMWMIIRNKENKYHLKQGDIIKLGRTLLRVKELKPNCLNDKLPASLKVKERMNSDKVDLLSHLSELDLEPMTKELGDEQASVDHVCRICYSGEVSSENPLISLCKCDGSLRYTHYDCFKFWMNSKLTEKKTEIYTFFSFKNLKCEICKTDYPTSIEYKGKTYHLMDIGEPTDHYMMLEMFTKDKDSSEFALKGFYVITMDPSKEVTIGRGRNSSIMISEISVSRIHCKISMSGDNFFLEDQDSKFGTLVSICQGILIHPLTNLELQINQIFITVSLVKNTLSRSWLCCGPQQINEAEVVLQDPEHIVNYVDTEEVKFEADS